ncbi:MAG: ChaN family lipoprotein [Desulfobacteraceae bacterium]|jgi:uncharacterized iron-regulated protein
MKTMTHRLFHIGLLAAALAAAGLSGCAPMTPKAPPMAEIRGVQGRFQLGEIVDLHQAERVDFETFMKRVAPHDLIFVGEVHDQAEHHLIQTQVLQALMACCGPVDLAMEFFRAPQQDTLDRYLAGEMTEAAFLKAADWDRTWGFPYHLYRPLLTLARENGSRILAINVSRDLVGKVAKVGLAGLTPEERARLPRKIDLTDDAHRDYVREAYLLHRRQGIPNFQFFYEAQCVYEEFMADTLSTYFENAGRNHRKLVAFVGNGHLEFRFGIPNRVLERTPVSAVTILPYSLSESTSIPSEIADFVWLTPSCGRRPPFMPPAHMKSPHPGAHSESSHGAQ